MMKFLPFSTCVDYGSFTKSVQNEQHFLGAVYPTPLFDFFDL